MQHNNKLNAIIEVAGCYVTLGWNLDKIWTNTKPQTHKHIRFKIPLLPRGTYVLPVTCHTVKQYLTCHHHSSIVGLYAPLLPDISTAGTYRSYKQKAVLGLQVRASSDFQMNQPKDAATCEVYYLSFRYSSTCFGHPHAHHQELQLQ